MIAELRRKSIHLSGLALPVLYLFLDKPTMRILVGILVGFALTVELMKRLSHVSVRSFFNFRSAPPNA